MISSVGLGPHLLAVLILEATVCVSWLVTGAALRRRGVNGPCELCLGMLAIWRGTVLLTMDWGRPGWAYLWGTVFAHCFLYAIHHLGIAMHCFREHAAALAPKGNAKGRPCADDDRSTTAAGLATGDAHRFRMASARSCSRLQGTPAQDAVVAP